MLNVVRPSASAVWVAVARTADANTMRGKRIIFLLFWVLKFDRRADFGSMPAAAIGPVDAIRAAAATATGTFGPIRGAARTTPVGSFGRAAVRPTAAACIVAGLGT